MLGKINTNRVKLIAEITVDAEPRWNVLARYRGIFRGENASSKQPENCSSVWKLNAISISTRSQPDGGGIDRICGRFSSTVFLVAGSSASRL